MKLQSHRFRRITAIVLSVILLISILPMASADTEETPRGLTLEELQEKFPHGKYWNGGDPDGWTEKPCTHHGSCNTYDGSCGCNSFMGLSIQCMGFAEKLGYDATGYNPRTNANGWQTDSSRSAINNLKAGDIVRRNGHSMYVTAVNGNTVTIADCNSYNRSCNIRWGYTLSKSDLYNNFEHVRSAPTQLVTGYNDLCQRYTSHGTVTLTTETIFYSAPCTTEIQATSTVVTVAQPDSQWQVTKLYLNTEGEYWYRTTCQDTDCYFLAGDHIFTGDPGDITISSVVAPKNTKKGSGFPIEGLIATDTLPLSKVGAYVYDGDTITDTPRMTSEDTPTGKSSYEIYSSKVDSNLTFGSLPVGNFTYAVKAWVSNHSVKENTLVQDDTEVLLYQSTFTVSASISCSHSYQPVANPEGLLAYQCSKCGYSYTVTVYDTDYTKLCTAYQSQGTVTLVGDTQLYSFPCSTAVWKNSVPVADVSENSSLTVTGLYQNPAGAYWYTTTWEGNTCYLYGGDGVFTPDNGNVTITGVSAPVHNQYQYGFPIYGNITSSQFMLDKVGAYIYYGSDGTLRMKSESTLGNQKTYSLRSSAVDNNLTFGSLAVGDYIYAVKAWVTNRHTDGETLYTQSYEHLLYQSTFTVSSSIPHTHSYGDPEVIAPTCVDTGLQTYRCTVENCDFSYTVTMLEPGEHTYGDWQTTVAPTYTQAGTQSKACTACGAVVTQSIAPLPTPVENWNLTLGDDIGVNFGIDLAQTDTVTVTVNGEDAPFAIDDGILSVKIAPAQMNDPIQISVNGTPLENIYTVREYAQTILTGDYPEATRHLVRAMLVYGITAQQYFGHNLESLESNNVDADPVTVPTENTDLSVQGKIDGVYFYAGTLVHEAKIALRFYFTGNIDSNTVFTVDGKAVQSVDSDKYPGKSYVEIPGLTPQDLGRVVTVTVQKGDETMTVSYSALSYLVRIYNRESSSEQSKALAKATYGYYLSALAYTGA